MKFGQPILAMMLLSLAACTGCHRAKIDPDKITTTTAPGNAEAFRTFLDTCRYPENPRSSDDWVRMQQGVQELGDYFARPEVIETIVLSPPERKYLESDVHLSEGELSEVEARSFRAADAFYLDECFLLRDAARSLEVTNLKNPIDQAYLHFRWVMRNVYLHEQGAPWTPPAFVLRRGYGNAVERALVFLALLRQAHIEGCLLVVPETEPKQFLVGVLESDTRDAKKPAPPKIHLFDTRMGIPLPGKETGKTATLQEVRDNPGLLQRAAMDPDEAKKMEAWLVCPLYALAPRMLQLQHGLNRHEAIVVHQSALALHKAIAAACPLPVKVWNPPASGAKPANSPTRCLRMFLPTQEGGQGGPNRIAEIRQARLPFDLVRLNYARINIKLDTGAGAVMPKLAYFTLMSYTEDLLDKYDLQIREMFLHGRFDPAIRRQERLQLFAKNDTLEGQRLIEDVAFRKELRDWLGKIQEVYAVANNPNDPKAQAEANKFAQALWYDQFVYWLRDLENEKGLDRDHKKSILTRILAVGLHDYFDRELARYQASFNHERAERAQAKLLASKPSKSVAAKAQDAWSEAENSWSKFYLDRINLEAFIQSRLDLLHRPEADLLIRVGLMELLHREIHQYFEAKLRLAECMEKVSGADAAQKYLHSVTAEIEDLERRDLLRTEIKNLLGQMDQRFAPPARQALQQRLDRLALDWADRGSFFWLKQRISP